MRTLVANLLLVMVAACTGCHSPDDSEDFTDDAGEETPDLAPAATVTVPPSSTFTGLPPGSGIKLSPDLRVTAIDVEMYDEATDKYKVTVTVTNGPAGSSYYKDYPGGGELYLRAVNSEHYPSSGFIDPEVELARRPIPVIPGGGTWKTIRYYNGRTKYVGTLRPVPAPPDWPAPPPLPETNTTNNEKTVSMLCDTNLTFTSSMLAANFPDMNDIDAHLTFTEAINPNLVEYEDGGSSHFKIPGLYTKTFDLNEIYLTTIGTMDYYYLPRHMQSTSSSVSIGNGTHDVCINFETGGEEELYCAVDGGPDSNCPNANATKLRICADFPLGFDQSSRLITIGQPDIQVTALWNITIGLNYDVSDLVNQHLKTQLASFLSTSQFRTTVGKNLTLFFHDFLLSDEHGNHGEITSFEVGDGAALFKGKSASGVLSFCPQ